MNNCRIYSYNKIIRRIIRKYKFKKVNYSSFKTGC